MNLCFKNSNEIVGCDSGALLEKVRGRGGKRETRRSCREKDQSRKTAETQTEENSEKKRKLGMWTPRFTMHFSQETFRKCVPPDGINGSVRR